MSFIDKGAKNFPLLSEFYKFQFWFSRKMKIDNFFKQKNEIILIKHCIPLKKNLFPKIDRYCRLLLFAG